MHISAPDTTSDDDKIIQHGKKMTTRGDGKHEVTTCEICKVNSHEEMHENKMTDELSLAASLVDVPELIITCKASKKQDMINSHGKYLPVLNGCTGQGLGRKERKRGFSR